MRRKHPFHDSVLSARELGGHNKGYPYPHIDRSESMCKPLRREQGVAEFDSLGGWSLGRVVQVSFVVAVACLGGGGAWGGDGTTDKDAAGEVANAVPKEPVSAVVDFRRDIRPLLSDVCFACHGPAEKQRESDLRLDTRAGAFVDLGGYQAIVPGKPDESALYLRLISDDEDERMPPADGDKKLTTAQIELVRQWISQGADFREHWAFEAPLKSPIPATASVAGASKGGWAIGDLDHFILERLQQEGMTPADAACRETLIRRATFDLTGLPPTLAQIDAFVNDQSPDAYERLLDRLLESQSYGEHMARFWLDVARYGDTHGLHLDNYREMWPYRDWVINAFNSNMPFDQFTIEQLAGDLLPEATLEQLIATGFNRSHVTTNEGGTIPEEFYVRNVIDRVDTTGQAFMGLTLGCAVCHEHKFDPISQTEFYQLFAYFNNLDGTAMDGNVKDHAPIVYVPTIAEKKTLADLDAKRAALMTVRKERRQRADSAFLAWVTWQRELLAGGSQISIAADDPAGLIVHLPLDETQGDKVVNVANDKTPASVHGPVGWTAGHHGGGFEFGDKESYIDLGKVAAFKKADRFSLGAWIKTKGDVTGAAISKMDQARNTGYELRVSKLRAEIILARSFPDLAIHVRTSGDVLQPNEWHHLFITYDGSKRATGVTIYVDGERQAVDVLSDQLGTYDFNTGKPLLLGRRDSKDPFTGGAIDDVRVYDRQLSEPEVAFLALSDELGKLLALKPDDRSEHQSKQLRTYYLTQYDSVFRDQTTSLEQLRGDVYSLNAKMATTLVFRERKEIRPAYLLERGEYDRHGDQTERNTPAIFPPLAKDQPNDRLGFARWLVSDEHPLTARVTVNRLWQQLFGTGIVKTAEDFGSQGEPPSHPELLDSLAVDFRESGWDVKGLMKRLMMSATYRQRAHATPETIAQDPDNRLLGRGPRFRLDAEMLRDQALAVSGLLVQRLGGPSVKPPQPDGLWFAVGYSGSNTVKFKADQGDDKIHRRTLYTFIKRTSPPPQMSIFDAPSREACSLRRERTNTPMQALLLLNDPQYFEAACALARRTLDQGGDSAESRAGWMFRVCTGRQPDTKTVDELVALLADELAAYKDDVDSAKKLIAVGTSASKHEVDTVELDTVELAAWTMLANVMLNLDEVVSKN